MINTIKILHIEDDEIKAGIVHKNLGQCNKSGEIEIVHVSNFKDALKEIQTKGYQAVLLDLGLKEVSGVDSINAIREEKPDLPIIVLSNADNEDMALKAIDSGAQEFLVKERSDGQVIKLAIHSSIKRKSIERKLFRQANYDILTGLPNRGLFHEHLEKSLNSAKRWGHDQAIISLDINKLAEINDIHGREAGDDVLTELADRMVDLFRTSDVISRYGDDEFMILLDYRSENKKESAELVGRKIIEATSRPFALSSGATVKIGVSVGIAVYPSEGYDSISILSIADALLCSAKRQGPNSICFYLD